MNDRVLFHFFLFLYLVFFFWPLAGLLVTSMLDAWDAIRRRPTQSETYKKAGFGFRRRLLLEARDVYVWPVLIYRRVKG